MRSKFSRAALIAGLGVGGSMLVSASADAALTAANNAVTTPTYYVTGPMVGKASTITPESAVVSGVIDTGGDTEALLPIPPGGLQWDGGVTISSGTAWADNSSGQYVPLNGIPVSGSNTNVSVSVTDAAVDSTGPMISSVSNGGADNFSTVTFAYDPVSDYEASGNQPGDQTAYATGVNVPTAAGLSNVETTIGAFGQAAQNKSGSLPLTPNTEYYYWLVQQAGGTDAATEVNVAQWASQSTNPADVCLPDTAIARDWTLAHYTTSTTITADGTTAPALAGPCVYYYGDANSSNSPSSPLGEFKTAALGTLVIAHSAKVNGSTAMVTVTNKSGFKASGELELDDSSGDALATGKFALAADAARNVKLKLTGKGVTAAEKGKSGTVNLTSNWDQPTSSKSVQLIEANSTGESSKKK